MGKMAHCIKDMAIEQVLVSMAEAGITCVIERPKTGPVALLVYEDVRRAKSLAGYILGQRDIAYVIYDRTRVMM